MEIATEELLNIIRSFDSVRCQSNLKLLELNINNYIKFLPKSIDIDNYDKINNHKTIDGLLYGRIAAELLKLIDNNYLSNDDILLILIEKLLIIDGSTFEMLHELLQVLIDYFNKLTNDATINIIIKLFEKLIKCDAIYSVIIDACTIEKLNCMEYEEFMNNWREFNQLLVSLPNRIANKIQCKINNDCFTLDTYTKIITYHIARATLFINNLSNKSTTIKSNIKIISMLISKFIFIFNSHRFIDLIDIIIDWSTDKKINMRNLINNILYEIDGSSIESIAVLLLKTIKLSSDTQIIFHNLLNNNQWRHILITKIPLLSYYNDDILIINLISYLAYTKNNDRLLIDLTIRLLDIWGDRSALNHTTLQQHEYITKLILLSVNILKDTLIKSDKDTIKRLLFDGTAAHLESMQIEIRAIGMITGELIVEYLIDCDDEPKLSYDYNSMPINGSIIVDRLKLFINNIDNDKNNTNNILNNDKIYLNDSDRKIYELGIKCCIISIDNDDKININSDNDINSSIKNNKCEISDNIEEYLNDNDNNDSDDLDSDDDLIPYDMSNDTKITDQLRPIYLRDLKDNLLNVDSNNDPNILSESLIIAEQLILSQLPYDDVSFAIELLKIFITLRESVYVENFQSLKFNSCIAIVTVYPNDTARYLCKEFHTEIGQYSINDKIFFLNILAESSRCLSKIPIKSHTNNSNISCDNTNIINNTKRINKPISLFIDINCGKKYETLYDDDFEISNVNNDNDQYNWYDIIDKRIKLNTKIISHKTKQLSITINKFNDAVSSFFYPLLYGLSQNNACLYKIPNLYSDHECILLIEYLKTISTIMLSAENCVIAAKMGHDILELAWTLRYHQQSKVRLCVIQNIASVIVSLSNDTYTNEIIELLLEFRTWLFDISQDSVMGDPDCHCRNLGKNVLALIDLVINSTINNI